MIKIDLDNIKRTVHIIKRFSFIFYTCPTSHKMRIYFPTLYDQNNCLEECGIFESQFTTLNDIDLLKLMIEKNIIDYSEYLQILLVYND